MKIKDNLTRKHISNYLSSKKGFPLKFSKKIIDDLLDVLSILIIKDKTILKNIGTFKMINKKERIGRNPKTKETYTIKPRKSLSFIPAKKIVKRLND